MCSVPRKVIWASLELTTESMSTSYREPQKDCQYLQKVEKVNRLDSFPNPCAEYVRLLVGRRKQDLFRIHSSTHKFYLHNQINKIRERIYFATANLYVMLSISFIFFSIISLFTGPICNQNWERSGDGDAEGKTFIDETYLSLKRGNSYGKSLRY